MWHSAEVIVESVARWQPALQPVWSDTDGCWCAGDHWIFRYDYCTGRLTKVFRLPRKSTSLAGLLKDTMARSWLRRRLAPGVGVDTLVQRSNGDVVLIYDQVYWYSPTLHQGVAEVLPFFGERGLAAPLRGGAAVHGKSQHVYFGEYLNGHQRDIRVARVDSIQRQVRVCWTFARSEIKHVHAIHYDRFRNRLWVCTGDRDHESGIYYTDDEFLTVHRFAGGDQSWRAIAMLFDESGMEWGMDAGQDAPADAINRIYRYDFSTGQRSEQAVIGNPAYATCDLDDGTALLQTSFEPKRRQPTEPEAALWHRGSDRIWRKIFSLAYQKTPGGGPGGYGMVRLPRGVAPSSCVLFSPANCVFGNGYLKALRVRNERK